MVKKRLKKQARKKPKKFNILMLGIAGVILFGVIIFLILNYKTANVNLPAVDCGNDLNCFISKASYCAQANLTYSQNNIEFLGWVQNQTYYYEIRGEESRKCILYTKLISSSGSYSATVVKDLLQQNMTMDKINQQVQNANKILAQASGQDGICKYQINSLVSYLNGLTKGSFAISPADAQTYNCSGILYQNPNLTY